MFPGPDTQAKYTQCQSSPDLGAKKRDLCSESLNFVRIKIESSNVLDANSFRIQVSDVLQRENEMQVAARANRIEKRRWSSSRIFRMWKSQRARRQQQQPTTNFENEEITLRLTPEVSLQNSNPSCSHFLWKPWLTTCMYTYYTTGVLRIPNECSGDDILLALEYFSILTGPDVFVFDSKRAYVKIQDWSRYFTHRADLAKTLLRSYNDAESELDRQFEQVVKFRPHFPKSLIWVLFKESESIVKKDFECQLLKDDTSIPTGGGSKTSLFPRISVRRLLVKQTGDLYDLFLGAKETKRAINKALRNGIKSKTPSRETPSRMRNDFCNYLEQSIPPCISVTFNIERVEITLRNTKEEKKTQAAVQYRPVIRFCHKELDSSTSIMKEKNDSNIDLLNPVEELSQTYNVINHETSEDKEKPLRGSFKKASGFQDLGGDNYLSFNELKCKNFETTEDQRHNHDLASCNSFNTIDAINRLKSNETRSIHEAQKIRKAITHIDMEFGDLRSVTSVLSEPTLDDQRCPRAIDQGRKVLKCRTDSKWYKEESLAQITAKKIVEKRTGRVHLNKNLSEMKESQKSQHSVDIVEPPQPTRNLRLTSPWDLDRTSNEAQDNKNFRKSQRKSKGVTDKSKNVFVNETLLDDTKTIQVSDASEWDDENTEIKFKAEEIECDGSWGQFLAGVCEVIIPTPSNNIHSSSPIRQFTISSSKSTSSTAASSDDADGFVDQAKRMGNDLSNQFDELMKIAYNEKVPKVVQSKEHQSLSPILEGIPYVLSIDADEDRTWTSCLTSSVVGQQRKNRTPEKFEKFQKSNAKCASNGIASNMAQGNEELICTGKRRTSSKIANRSSCVAKDYSKEKRYSQHENRFYA